MCIYCQKMTFDTCVLLISDTRRLFVWVTFTFLHFFISNFLWEIIEDDPRL